MVLLVSWTSYIDLEPQCPFELLEFFAGHASVARAAEAAGYRSAAVDILYDEAREKRKMIGKRSPFDLNSDAGFALLTWYLNLSSLREGTPKSVATPCCEACCCRHPRLAVAMVLQGTWSQVVCFFGTCCSSFVNINSGTSGRSALVPEGCDAVPSVRSSNKLLCRTAAVVLHVRGFLTRLLWV